MRENRFLIFLILVLLVTISYRCENHKEYMTRHWVIDNLNIDGVDYGVSLFSFNILELSDDGKGNIPRLNNYEHDREMSWELIEIDDDEVFIEIKEAEVDCFNKKFKLIYLDKKKSKIKLVSRDVTIICTSLYYYE